VADDNADGLETMAVLLELAGYRVAEARNGQEAVALVRSLSPEAVLLDLQMPVMGGLEAARVLRAELRFEKLFIAAVTGHGDPVTLERLEECGFDAHFLKPIDFDRLLSELRSACQPD